MRSLPFALALSLAAAALACGGGDAMPAGPAGSGAHTTAAETTDASPVVASSPQVYFIQIDT